MRVTRKVQSTENASLIMHRLKPVAIVALLEFCICGVFFVFDTAGTSHIFYFSVKARKEPGSSRVINEDRQPFPVYLLHFPFVEVILDEGQLMLTPRLKERG